jgi:hypothetical protein
MGLPVISLIVVLEVFDMVLGASDSRWEDVVLRYEAGEGAVLECEDNYQTVHPVALNFNLFKAEWWKPRNLSYARICDSLSVREPRNERSGEYSRSQTKEKGKKWFVDE